MEYFGAYFVSVSLMLIWVACDRNAASAFEFFHWRTHSIARTTSFYWSWLAQTAGRVIPLAILTGLGLAAAVLMFLQDPWELGPVAVSVLSGFMLTTSVAMLALPSIAADLHWQRFLRRKAAGLSEIVSFISSKAAFQQHFEPADWDADEGWTAWHPTGEEWEGKQLWDDLVPLVYLRSGDDPALIVPVDFGCYLAWNVARIPHSQGAMLPIYPRSVIESAEELRGGGGWWIISATWLDEDEELAA